MGDRTYVEMTVRKCDAAIWAKAFDNTEADWLSMFSEVKSETDTLVCGYMEDANYAVCDERQEAANAGAVFTGSHESGGDYPAMDFFGRDGVMLEWETSEGYCLVCVDYDGNISPKLKKAVKYFITEQKRVAYSLGIVTGRYKIQHSTIGDWEDNERDENGNIITYATQKEAQKELDSLIADTQEAFGRGDMAEAHDPNDYRIVKIDARGEAIAI